jgi:hypothetical protein
MTQASTRLQGNVVLGVAFIVLLVNLCAMAGWIPKVAPPFSLNLLAFALVLVAHKLRRRSRGAGPSA